MISRKALLVQGVIDVYGGDYFHRIAVEKSRFVDPVLDRLHGGLYQHRVAGDDLKVFYQAIGTDFCIESYSSLNARLFGVGRIERGHLLQEVGRLHRASNAKGGWPTG